MPAKKKNKDLNKQLKDVLSWVKKNRTKSILLGAATVIVILFIFPLRFLIIPASVNGQPIFSWEYLTKLHQSAGTQVINQLISEKLIEQEIQKSGIQISQAEIDAQINKLESQLGDAGGLDTMLSVQGLTRDEFISQLKINLGLEKLVKGTIEITDEQIKEELAANAEIYASLEKVDAATTAAENIRNDKLQNSFQTWFQELRTNSNIKTFLPGTASTPLGS